MKEEFLEAVQSTLNPERQSNLKDYFRQDENWDSLAYLALNLMIEEKYGIEIPRDHFRQMETLEDIYNYVKDGKGNMEVD